MRAKSLAICLVCVSFYSAALSAQVRTDQGSSAQHDSASVTDRARTAAEYLSNQILGTRNGCGSPALESPAGAALAPVRNFVRSLLPPSSAGANATAQGISSQGASGPLLRKIVSNVDISSDTTLNVTLDVGFVLSGTINAPPGEQPVSISAVGSGGNVFQGAINPQTNAYQIFVAGDTYTLTTCFTIGPLGPTSTFNDPTQIVVTGTTSYDTTLPTITAFNVSGTVSGINPASFNSIMFSASDNSSSGSFMIAPDGSYSGKLPNGNYNVAVSALSFITFQQSTSVAGSLVVNGSDTTGNFSVPSLATLSGVVVRPDGPIPPNSIITASDVTAQGGSSCVAQVTNSGFAQINPASGGYGLTLAKGHTYNVGVALPVVPAAPPQSMGFFVFTTTIDLADDGTAEIDVPALPNMATVSGLVSGPDGNPLTMIPVVGIAQGLSGTPNASFSRGTSTNMTGVYSLTVLSSSSYTLGFIPGTPPPQ